MAGAEGNNTEGKGSGGAQLEKEFLRVLEESLPENLRRILQELKEAKSTFDPKNVRFEMEDASREALSAFSKTFNGLIEGSLEAARSGASEAEQAAAADKFYDGIIRAAAKIFAKTWHLAYGVGYLDREHGQRPSPYANPEGR